MPRPGFVPSTYPFKLDNGKRLKLQTSQPGVMAYRKPTYLRRRHQPSIGFPVAASVRPSAGPPPDTDMPKSPAGPLPDVVNDSLLIGPTEDAAHANINTELPPSGPSTDANANTPSRPSANVTTKSSPPALSPRLRKHLRRQSYLQDLSDQQPSLPSPAQVEYEKQKQQREYLSRLPGASHSPAVALNARGSKWTAERFDVEAFDMTQGGKFVGLENVICDSHCQCREICESCNEPHELWVETILRCDGSYVQWGHHYEHDGGPARRAHGKHSLVLRPCGDESCKICRGAVYDTSDNMFDYDGFDD